MKIQNCNGKYFGNALCRIHVAFALTIMDLIDLVLFFSDTFLWWIIRNTILSIGIFTRLPKRIYAKLLAAADLDTKYKPKVLVSQSDKGLKGEFFTPSSEAERRFVLRALAGDHVPEPILLMQCGRSQSWRCGREIRPTHPSLLCYNFLRYARLYRRACDEPEGRDADPLVGRDERRDAECRTCWGTRSRLVNSTACELPITYRDKGSLVNAGRGLKGRPSPGGSHMPAVQYFPY
ncbi:uncharacterized protein B0H18DRAFT_1216815 [Fomitopsis serialis]|uniref:uncharacterized protein n=1 Tax=Fomitopsis serialis TaxID=139415 RepID=UPI0020078EDA|nr:uncharacterized protein B0H18DRAFT_1216815 [Neoantrodia serialis]KAH9912754.1 hypothetical protein B0H18DRAFT_1216815 [Neoantrodia serialis]